MTKIQINSDKAPNPGKLLSHGILTSSKYKLEISGQIGLDPKTFTLVNGGIGNETVQTFKNLKNILTEIGWGLENLTKVRIYITNIDDYFIINEIYESEFKDIIPPSRVLVEVSRLPLGASVELECVAEGDEYITKNLGK